jgi:radical SAM protein with 4Fe4S-binding SPASM domain
MSLMLDMGLRALKQGIPLRVHLDLTYRCNERCVHCYLDHDDHGELTTGEVLDLLDQMAAAQVFFLTLSGGEIFMRPDLFEIIARARGLQFSVKLKTNAVMVTRAKAERLAALGIEGVQISLYSHKAEVHDEITKLPNSFRRTIAGARLLTEDGIQVKFANVLMANNHEDYIGVQELAKSMGIGYTVDATITPMMDGDRSVLDLNVSEARLREIYHDERILGGQAASTNAPPKGPLPEETAYSSVPCSAGHNSCYVSPYGEVYPCVQFPYLTGNIREQKFIDIWRNSERMKEVRSIRMSDLQGCSSCVHGSSCSRCPGLAYLEGNMRGPSTQDCERSFARTAVPSKNLERKRAEAAAASKPAKFPIPIVVVA